MSVINILLLFTLLLTVALIAVTVVALRYIQRQRRFLSLLSQTLASQKNQHIALNFPSTPKLFEPLLQVLQQLQQQVPFSIEHDKLTGLANRVGCKRYLKCRLPLQKGLLVLVDIQRFRFVNNLFGFAFGDLLLQDLAKRIQTLTPTPDFVARMNGDEFLMFYQDELSDESLQAIKLHLQRIFEIEQTPISVKMQLGVLNLKLHNADMSLMLRRLDLALKKAKQCKKSMAHYQQDDDMVQYRELLIINSLPKALKQEQMYLLYQAKLNLHSGDCQQVEALIRWQHPSLGSLSPVEFIPLAEHSGMIDLVSYWVLDTVLAQQAAWLAQGFEVKVAVNLSTSDLDNPQLAEEINAKLKHYNVPAASLVIEITESVLMEDLERTISRLQALRSIGVKLAIDDFGTGHSSLAYLRFLPVDEVKIDKAFLEDFDSDNRSKQLIKSSIELAKNLGFEVTVEGVESKSVLEQLKSFGVDTIQGDYYAKPLEPEAFQAQFIAFNQQASH
ncbi:bifunctional diguanylate cyclase/phosphodiesterase [Shewanella sp. SR44-3]|uniref:putative bifunctional diguanylate cyclase/phosphodiesterase n=1 Tax=Shewanella sp. SR44-3 TaxID=2760936 RepID=UPI0015FDE603|nr:bifunctional diguanylate cyclase/phosphodiesterase [Shewanella sp. SR44-3]MBB1270198.1 bifunctional diguanylate cyclase/phosphodiesterase [Shewanella sp. SR44-3]